MRQVVPMDNRSTDGADRFDEYEEKLDELNAGLLDAYAAGYAKALRDHDIDDVPFTNPDKIREWNYIKECSYYYWDGKQKPLKRWLREEFDIVADGGESA